MKLTGFDRDTEQHFRYHNRLVKLCRVLAAINDDEELFNKNAPRDLRKLTDNQQIRWKLEDRIRELLRKNGNYPKRKHSPV